jgi:hypothetical protein
MVVLVVTGFRAALEMSRVARVRVICERSGSTPKGHTQRQHKRRDQQRYTPLHLLSPPFAHSPQHHRPKERRMEGEAHPKAPPLLLSQGVGLSLGLSIGRDPTTFRQPGYLSCGEVHGLCAPASRRVCLYRGAGAPERTRTSILPRRRAVHMPHGHLSGARRASCMPGSYSLLGELLRTPATRSSSQSTYKAKF